MDACAALQAAPILDAALSDGKPPAAIVVPSGIFRTKNGYVTVASLSDTMFEALLKALGLDAMRSDPRYATLEARRKNAPAINAEVARILAGEDTRHWVLKLSAADVLCAEVMDYAGFRASPQATHMRHSAKWISFPYGTLPVARVPGEARMARGSAPRGRAHAGDPRGGRRDRGRVQRPCSLRSDPPGDDRSESALNRILVTDPIDRGGIALLAAGAEVVHPPDTRPDTLRALAREVDAVITRSRLPDDLFEVAPRIRAVMIHGTGTDLVNLASASEHGVMVANMPGGNAQSVAEYCLMAIMLLARNFRGIDTSLRNGTWDSARALADPAVEVERKNARHRRRRPYRQAPGEDLHGRPVDARARQPAAPRCPARRRRAGDAGQTPGRIGLRGAHLPADARNPSPHERKAPRGDEEDGVSSSTSAAGR